MRTVSKRASLLALSAVFALPLASPALADEFDETDGNITVFGDRISEGPKFDGIISARSGDKVQVTLDDGRRAVVMLDSETRIKASGGFLGMKSKKLAKDSLMNGLPVSVETLRMGRDLIASEIKLKNDDLKMASMVRNGTAQQFAEHGAAIDENKRVAEALRGRMGDIDKYNVKGTTNVYFDSGKYALSADAERELCAAASQADGMDNALLLVVGYTDSTGSYEVNQALSEKRAGRVVNHLQQACGWKPWRMLSPTGMAQSDPLASNDTAEGKAQNRRVAVNILVSKGLDGL